ncbi:MAG: LpxI family protein [Pseudomonadota bacterium]|jgi:DUF1009 family protein|nr:UDP-2,3-diacylglucosamine diphosphatase LpxI [Alphaproteobacteria bacterium]
MSAKSRLKKAEPLGIIAGSGTLFSLVLQEAFEKNYKPIIVSFREPDEFFDSPHLQTTLGKIGEILDFLKKHHVKKLIFAGRIQRPSLANISVDGTGFKWIQKLGMKAFAGDDALLKGITELLAEESFEIISPKDFLPSLVLSPGVYSKTLPTKENESDIARGQQVLNILSSADVGQACIVQEGLVLGIEAIEGTQVLIKRCKDVKRHTIGGVLIKLAKNNQSTLLDLPTIGPDTIEAIHQCKLSGLAISAHTTQVLNFHQVIELCNKYKIFLKVIEAS